jgi:hypothetical protein
MYIFAESSIISFIYTAVLQLFDYNIEYNKKLFRTKMFLLTQQKYT